MHLENFLHGSRRIKSILALAGFLLVIIASASLGLAQSPVAPQTDQELSVSDLLKLPGKVLGEGANQRAVGKYRVARYRVEELTLPRTVEVEIRGQKVHATQAYRLTIVGGPFPVRALPPVVWIDDTPIGYGVENEDLNAITAITFDQSLLREGATIYLSYGDKEDKTDRVALPEKLKLDGPRGGNQ
ncbi:MAG TPA: hypothetical protein VGB17_02775 [Pyrinomonadaceae bacterium]|jgi:hypothetical protein